MPNHVVQAEVKDLEHAPQFDFVAALDKIKHGANAAPSGWNGNRLWIAFIPADQSATGSRHPYGTAAVSSRYLPWIGMETAEDAFVPCACSRTGLLAEDLHIAE